MLYSTFSIVMGPWDRNRTRRRNRGGFSLVELTVVIVIIGVLAAIAVPRISRGAQGAGGAATKADLAVMRKAIDMYAAEHGGAFPGKKPDGLGNVAETEGAFLSQMIKFTDYDGNANDTRTYPFVYGPYIAKGMPPAPIGAFTGSSAVKVDTTGPARTNTGNYGWVYNVNNGEIILNTSVAEEAEIMEKFDMRGSDLGLPSL